MRDPRIDRLADVIVGYSTKVKKGDLVGIRSDPIAMPLIEAVFEKCLKVGAHPYWEATASGLDDLLLEHASDEQLEYLSPLLMQSIETLDVRIVFWAEVNTKSMSRVDSSKQRLRSAARSPYMKRFMERAADGGLRWCGTLFPTAASAQDAEMSLKQYEDFVFAAGMLHLDDPAAAWKRLAERQQRAVDWLNTKKQLHFRAPARNGHDGTDLRVSVDGATWINCCGGENFPDGEVFAGPQGVDGHVNYTFPAVHNGREVDGIRLAFKGGRVIDASARRNEEFLIAMLDQDEGARNLGEIAIGTNYSIKECSRNTLFDEKIGGTFHAAVGAGYPESGNSNESGLHWDMVCDLRPDAGGGSITADGEEFFRDGRFLFDGWPSPE
ncbi:MAG: aminopeptidase [Phycisphaerales bacterium]